MRCQMRSATSGEPLRASFGFSTSGFVGHDPPGPDRNRNFPDPVRDLCAVPDRDAIRPHRAVLVALSYHREIGARLLAAGDRELRPAGEFFRGTAAFNLRSRP